jgi:hypothetical protein
MKENTYLISVSCSWITPVKAKTVDEAIRKTEERYKYGKGRFPREYTEVSVERNRFCQVE